MKVRSTNTSQPRSIRWKNREETTGIFKKPQPGGVFLDRDGVQGDHIGNPRVHGGPDKACYLFAVEEYDYWRQHYDLPDWDYGVFGENLSVDGLDESNLSMGAVYSLGAATIRITTPREPCYKLGIRFGDQGIVDHFIRRGRPGAYAEVLWPGRVNPGDELKPIDVGGTGLDIASFYRLLFSTEKDPDLIEHALQVPVLTEKRKNQLRRWLHK